VLIATRALPTQAATAGNTRSHKAGKKIIKQNQIHKQKLTTTIKALTNAAQALIVIVVAFLVFSIFNFSQAERGKEKKIEKRHCLLLLLL